ncbi:hypothetical protein [Candidatus Rickettsia colombianensi]|uniref:hypothetical protein n=1 Tax=Candidatus Rickettsia colombianensi TaxID=1090944 RepID=UPI0015B0362B|nr:hypothetical protein [Candidatus Rickettsia colombianensi]
MKINYEDISSYTTALCTIAGAAVIGPLLIIKDKVSAILDARKNPAQEYSC